MELTYRKGADRFVAAGAYRDLESRVRRREAELAEIPAVVLAAFDRSTRLLPLNIYDRWIFPAGARYIAAALWQAGFRRTRAVFQLWNRNFRISRARLDGQIPQLFLVSSMQIHSRKAYEAVRDAHALGDQRPLIIAGGPKASYQPYHYWADPWERKAAAPDVVVTGEAFILLDLINTLLPYRGRGETLRTAFERARREGALNDVPGLVYCAPDSSPEKPELIDTGLQRLVQNLDEFPDEVSGLALLEPPHRGRGLSARPLPDHKVRFNSPIVGLLVTQGCRFTCPYCPIPALQQKSWRFRSSEGLAEQVRMVYERFRIKQFYGADDNFFNHRESAQAILQGLADARVRDGYPLGSKIRFSTEATQSDTWKNRDLLPLAQRAGLHALWFGIEDLTAQLVNKGQKPEKTVELFRLLYKHRICPMAMLMYHAGQPFYQRGGFYGLANQVEFLRRAGAYTIQCTVHTPALGSREYEETYATGKVIRSLGSFQVPESKTDGNHVMVDTGEPMWLRQIKLLGGYATFYNPLNLVRALFGRGDRKVRRRKVLFQLAGMVALFGTALRTLPYVFRLLLGKPAYHEEAPPLSEVPVRSPASAFSRVLPDSPLLLIGRMRETERHSKSA